MKRILKKGKLGERRGDQNQICFNLFHYVSLIVLFLCDIITLYGICFIEKSGRKEVTHFGDVPSLSRSTSISLFAQVAPKKASFFEEKKRPIDRPCGPSILGGSCSR